MPGKKAPPDRLKKKHTIRDVARRANVSPMSVSNYINDRFHLMRDETRERIRKAIEALQYRPQSNARSLRLRKDFSVGVIIVEPSPNFLVEPYIGHVVSGLSSRLADQGYSCVLQGLRSCSLSESIMSNYARVDALCVFPSGPRRPRRAFIEQLLTLGGPIVAIQEDKPFDNPQIAVVRQDDFGGAKLVLNHLLTCGARSFIHLVPAPVWPSNTERWRGLRATLARFPGRTSLTAVTCGFGNYHEVQRTLQTWFDAGNRCDAIVGNNDHIGIAALKFLVGRGMRVPNDIMVTGFSGFESWNYSSPLLTTIESPADAIGREAADIVLARLRSGSFARRDVVLPVSLRPGQSTIAGFKTGRATR